MAVHMIRVLAAAESTDTDGMTLSEINDAMDDWMSKQSEWEVDPVQHAIRETSTTLDGGTAYYTGSYRLTFESEPKDNLLQKCGDKLKEKLDWYRLGYHECSHDAELSEPCQWGDEREWLSNKTDSIPAGVPDFL